MGRWCTALLLALAACVQAEQADEGLIIITTNEGTSDGHQRFLRSAKAAEAEVIAIPSATSADADVQGQTVTRLRAELERHAATPRRPVLVLQAPTSDTIVTGSQQEIVTEFQRQKGRVLFSGDANCRPDAELADRYPKSDGYRFLNSHAFIGHASDLLALLSDEELVKSGGDQLAFTKLFLDEERRQKYGVLLDSKANIMQNLDDVGDEVVVRFKGREAFIQNLPFSTVPLLVYGGASSRQQLGTLGNYLAGAWDPREGCHACWDDQKELRGKPDKFPSVLLALFIDQPTPFLEEFLGLVRQLIYPKNRIDLFIYSASKYHQRRVADFMKSAGDTYRSATLVDHEDDVDKMTARRRAIDKGLATEAEFFMMVDSTAHLNNPYALKLLIEQNRDVVAPMLIRPYSAWANFKTELTLDRVKVGHRASEYKAIATDKRKGLWNVPYISDCYLVKRAVFSEESTRPDFDDDEDDVHEVFSATMRNAGKFLLVSNRADFGHLVDPDGFETSHLHDEMWQIFANRWDWERRYIHENFSRALDEKLPVAEPCPDVFWVPIISERFCQEIIETMEDFGEWSSGKNEDSRLDGGYENVPTRDIHMKQINYDLEWHQFLREYVQPVQKRVFLGYDSDPPQANLNFVVRYRPDEQPALRPHHDASTYTINIALNTPHKDYEGGGCRFVRQDCAVTESRRGWLLMHPGRLTHYHEGLPVTKGTRYIFVSFVDPE